MLQAKVIQSIYLVYSYILTTKCKFIINYPIFCYCFFCISGIDSIEYPGNSHTIEMNIISFEGEAKWSPTWFSSGWRKSQPLIWSGSYLEVRNALSSPSLHNLISSTPNNTKPLRISTWSQGLNMLRIIYKPTATTIAYGLDKKGGCWEEYVDCRSWWWPRS